MFYIIMMLSCELQSCKMQKKKMFKTRRNTNSSLNIIISPWCKLLFSLMSSIRDGQGSFHHIGASISLRGPTYHLYLHD